MVTIYGIKNCNTMQKACAALTAQGIAYTLHDYKKQGIDLATLHTWASQLGPDILLNKQGSTWRKLSPAEQAEILSSPQHTLQALVNHPSMIKRPILVHNDQIIVGFNIGQYQQLR